MARPGPGQRSRRRTIGGLLASGDAGPRRLRYGSLRDLAIGSTLVLADGTIAHAGSHVINNVAGYDLTKLFHGSLGSLGLIAEVIVRLHPIPPASATVLAAATAAQATVATEGLTSCGVEPTAVEWLTSTGDRQAGLLLVRVDGSPAGVATAQQRLATLLAGLGLTPECVPTEDAAASWQQAVAGTHDPDTGTVLRAGTLPSRLPQVEQALTRLTEQHGVSRTLVSSTALGLHTATLTGPPAAQAAVATGWRAAVGALGGVMALRERPAAVDAELDALGPPPAAIAVLRALKTQLDPYNRCAPGRFRGWY